MFDVSAEEKTSPKMGLGNMTLQFGLFLTSIAFMCTYHIVLSVAAAHTGHRIIVLVTVVTVIMLLFLLSLGIAVYLRTVKSGTAVPFKLEGSAFSNEGPQNVSRAANCSLVVNPRVQEGASGNIDNPGNSKDGNLQVYRPLRSSAMVSLSLPFGSNFTTFRGKSFSLSCQPQRLSSQQVRSFSEDKTAVDGKGVMAHQGGEVGEGGELRAGSLTKTSSETRHQSLQSKLSVCSGHVGLNFTLEEMRSLDSHDQTRPRHMSEVSHERIQQLPETLPLDISSDGNQPLVIATKLPLVLCWVLCIVIGVLMIVLLAGSFWIAYDSGCVMMAILVFAAPLFYLHIMQFLSFFHIRGSDPAFDKAITFLLCPAVPIILALLAVSLFVAVFVVSLNRECVTPSNLYCENDYLFFLHVVCMCSPIPVFFVAGVGFSFSILVMTDSPTHKVDFLSHASSSKRKGIPISNNPLVSSNGNVPATGEMGADAEESVFSSIILSRYPSLSNVRSVSTSNRSFRHAPQVFSEIRRASFVLPPSTSNVRVDFRPQVKNVTMLYVAFQKTISSCTISIGDKERRLGRLFNQSPELSALCFQALVETAKGLENSCGPFALTAHGDAVCLVWGLQPLSEDPILRAINTANSFFAAFTSPGGSEGKGALVAAVIQSPHALVSSVGTNDMSGLHFLSNEHSVGRQLLDRGFVLRGFEHQTHWKNKFSTSGLILDSRTAHLVASHILCRPVGFVPFLSSTCFVSESGVSTSMKTELDGYTVIYDFISWLDASQEEWHLAQKTREESSKSFFPAVEAAQAFFQGRLGAAIEAVETGANSGEDVLMQLLLTDLKNIPAVSNGRLR